MAHLQARRSIEQPLELARKTAHLPGHRQFLPYSRRPMTRIVEFRLHPLIEHTGPARSYPQFSDLENPEEPNERRINHRQGPD